PYDDESRLNLARLKAIGDDAATATELLEPLVEEGGEPEFVVPAALLRSQMAVTLGSTEAAIEDAETAIEVLPEDPWGYLQKAAALLGASRPGDAIAVLKEAESRIPAGEDVPDLHALRASAYQQLGKQEKAAEHQQKGRGAARLPEIVYGPDLNPARDVPVDPNQPISVDALLEEIFGDADQAPEGYREEVRDMLGRIPEIAEENPGANQVEIELPPLEPGGES
ncbi:MAG: tetratricopeptide repeat protein, partial [Bradymonadaceae bacterium]